jgi:purine-binding chemotaxis protein CheW
MTMNTQTLERAETGGDASQMVLTLTVAGQLCGVPVLAVRDVLGPQTITRIPLAPPEVAGSLNLRGRIVTAVDLRRRLSLPPRPAGERPMSVVVEHQGELYSLLADQVGEVLSLSPGERAANPPTLDASWKEVSLGVHRLGEALLVVMDVECLMRLS